MAKLTKDLLARELEIREYINKYATLFELDPNLVRGLITQESAFIADAQSSTGAFGFGQFTGIGARQVQNIAGMTDKASDLVNFQKRDASDPDKGIKAICATLWWLLYRKYASVSDKQTQLEAALTFYNGGGRPANLVIRYGSHEAALPYLKELPSTVRSQSVTYAPKVAAWYVAWHEYMKSQDVPVPVSKNPLDESRSAMCNSHHALIRALMLYAEEESSVAGSIDVRDGLTELTLIFPGEYE